MSHHQTKTTLNNANKQCDKQPDHKPLIVRYTEALKAMLDFLPENTDSCRWRQSIITSNNYLWVIEKLLRDIYELLEDNAGLNPEQIINEFVNFPENILQKRILL